MIRVIIETMIAPAWFGWVAWGGGVRLDLWRRVRLAHTLSTPYPRWWYVGCMVVVMLMCWEQIKMRLFCITPQEKI